LGDIKKKVGKRRISEKLQRAPKSRSYAESPRTSNSEEKVSENSEENQEPSPGKKTLTDDTTQKKEKNFKNQNLTLKRQHLPKKDAKFRRILLPRKLRRNLREKLPQILSKK